MVWYQLSSMGSLLGNLLLARKALEQALCCQPNYWPALESLCTVLYALGDYSGICGGKVSELPLDGSSLTVCNFVPLQHVCKL